MRKGLLCLIGATVVLLPAPGVLASDAMEAEGLQTERPVVSVVMPLGFGQSAIGYVIGAGSESKLIVALEVTDATGHGIVANDKGIPAFVEPDQNVELFTRYITMVGTIIAPAGVTISTAGQTAQTTLIGRALGLTASVTMVNTTLVAP